MSSSADDNSRELIAPNVVVTTHHLTVEFTDGRVVSLPLSWFARLAYASPGHRRNVEIGAIGLHWPDLDEDLSYEGILAGRRSGESLRSFRRWLSYYVKGKLPPVKTVALPPDVAEYLVKVGVDIGEHERRRFVARKGRRKAS